MQNQLFNLNRDNSYLTQTPQAFKYKDIYNLSIKQKNKIHPIVKNEKFSDKSTQYLFIEYLSMYGHGNLKIKLLAASYYMITKKYKLVIIKVCNKICRSLKKTVYT